MRIFGRSAKTDPTVSGAPSVPPELQPYYDGQTRRARIARRVRQLVPLIIAVILGALIIGGAFWLRAHRTSNQTASNTHSSSGQTKSQQQQNKSKTQPNTTGGTTSPNMPSPNSSGSSGTSGTSSGQSQTQKSQMPATNPSVPPAANQQVATIPNTGPGAGALAVASLFALLGACANYLRQLRRTAAS